MRLPITVVVLIAALLMVLSETIYLSNIVEQQRHTIRQLQGLELGPHDTPRMPAYVPDADERSI